MPLFKCLLMWLWFSLSIIIIFEGLSHLNLIFHLYLKMLALYRGIKGLLLNIVKLLLVSVAFDQIYVTWRLIFVLCIYITWSVYCMSGTLLEFSFFDTCKVHVNLVAHIFLASKLIFFRYNSVVITWLQLHILREGNSTVFLERVLNHLSFLRLR